MRNPKARRCPWRRSGDRMTAMTARAKTVATLAAAAISCTPSSTATPGSSTSRTHDDEVKGDHSAGVAQSGRLAHRTRREREGVISYNGGAYSPGVGRHLRRARDHAQNEAPVSTADQRQDQAPPPHPGREGCLKKPYPSETAQIAAPAPWVHPYGHTGPTRPSAKPDPSPGWMA